MMKKTGNMPLWVFLAFSSIKTRKMAVIFVFTSLAFSIYCVPWLLFFPDQNLVTKIFLIEDWIWFAMMAPMTFWYWLSMRWIDQNLGWGLERDKSE
jgi:hypothetical protein